ncbi:MAG: ribonuclease HI family protein [Synergistota bacterium]|nr:ribonuclease HI family protein [Synergistota bacterium]
MVTGYFDGASRGNPGEAGAGALLLDDERNLLWEDCRALGTKTNNEAEYEALIMLLEKISAMDLKRVEVRGDSRLVINQMRGEWKIKEPRLAELASRAQRAAGAVRVNYVWIPREKNTHADRLSNKAMDGPGNPAAATLFSEEKLERVTENIYIAHGIEDYAVDLLHGVCTCPAFRRKGACKHLDAARRL